MVAGCGLCILGGCESQAGRLASLPEPEAVPTAASPPLLRQRGQLDYFGEPKSGVGLVQGLKAESSPCGIFSPAEFLKVLYILKSGSKKIHYLHLQPKS